MLQQEIGWFDDPVNGIGALCSRLAADAAAVQGVSSTISPFQIIITYYLLYNRIIYARMLCTYNAPV